MRHVHLLGFLALFIAGCHNTLPNQGSGVIEPTSDGDLAAMKEHYARLREQNLSDCLRGSPENIKANQELCMREREEMAPLGNAIEAAEVKAARHVTNP